MSEPQTHDRSTFAFRTRGDRRCWPIAPIQDRVARWLKRVAKNTAAYARPHRMEIPQKYATALDLPTRWVELREDGTLWHSAKPEPIATLQTEQ